MIEKLQKAIRRKDKIDWFEEKLSNGKNIFKPIEKIVEKIDKLFAVEFIKFLDNQLNKHINQQAYDILKEDIEWLINN